MARVEMIAQAEHVDAEEGVSSVAVGIAPEGS